MNYSVLTKQVKLRTWRETVSNLKSIKIVGFERTSTKFIYLLNNNFITGRKPVLEIISVVINGSSDLLYFDLYLINIFAKSVKVETLYIFKLTLYFWSVTVKDLNL